jgi:hypothetical protein
MMRGIIDVEFKKCRYELLLNIHDVLTINILCNFESDNLEQWASVVISVEQNPVR